VKVDGGEGVDEIPQINLLENNQSTIINFNVYPIKARKSEN